jgi:DNA-binding XRE family transcriptional regulator
MDQITELERARARLRMTQQQVADIAGVHRDTILRAERGQYPGRYITRLRIAEAVQSTPEDLFASA